MSLFSLMSTSQFQPTFLPAVSGTVLTPPAIPTFQQPAAAPAQNNSMVSPASLMMMLLVSLIHELFTQLMGPIAQPDTANPPPAAGYPSPDPGNTPSPDPAYTPPVYTYDPPPPKEQIKGSAGLFGDPQFGLFSPQLGQIPNALKAFESNIKPGETVTLLNDPDAGGLNISAKAVQVDPNNADSSGIGTATFKSGNDTVIIHGNGDLIINGQKKGNINDTGMIAPITLASGLTISTAQEIDGANGAKAERFVITNGEYKMTAATRKPHADSTPYLDMNFEELEPDAADNATGYQTTIPGIGNRFGIVDLLRLEPGDLQVLA
jgi:hypothetical protein